jgi:hypothetical protein
MVQWTAVDGSGRQWTAVVEEDQWFTTVPIVFL